MFFARIRKIHHSLAFRLTLWYALVFIVSAVIVFFLFYILITTVIQQRIDEDLKTQRNELAGVYALQGIEMLERSASLYAQAAGERKIFYRLFYTSGVVFSSSNMTYWRSIGIDRQAVESILTGANHVVTTHVLNQGRDRARVIYARMGARILLQLGYAMNEEQRLLVLFRQIFVTTMSGLLILAVLVGWFMARRALSGVDRLTRTARQISENDLLARVPVRNPHSEIDRLAVTFNQMLDRIQNLVASTRQMNDNIAHDLRSPIARIRGLAEVNLTQATDLPAYQQMTASTIEECDRLLDMINTMLTISRTEAGVAAPRLDAVDMSDLVAGACELFQPLAEDRQLSLEMEVSQGMTLEGDPPLIQRLVANLIDNAIKYTDAGGTVTVVLKAAVGEGVYFGVRDTGIGIAPREQSKVFERFYRGDQSRSQGGSGLGLSLAQVIAQAHGTRIEVQSRVGRGTTFAVLFPPKDK